MQYLKTIALICGLASTCLCSVNADTLSQHDEQELGKAFMQELRHEVTFCDDPLISNYVNTLGNKLVSNSDHHNTKFNFFVVVDSAINSFAGPGGYIGINSGLLLTTQSESELAAVLSHEITHVNQHHLSNMMAKASQSNMSSLAIILAGALLGGVTHSNIGEAAVMAAMDSSAQNMLSFSRSNEEEADRIGMQVLYKSGFDPKAMPSFFERMQRYSMEYGQEIPPYLQTHPVTADRIADAENRVQQYPNRKDISSLDYYLVQARLRVMTTPDGYAAVGYFKKELDDHDYTNLEATKYGYALALLYDNKKSDAYDELQKLIQKNPHEIIYAMALAECKNEAHQYESALQILQNSLSYNPNYYPLIMQYGKTLLDAKHADTARIFLQKYITSYPDDIGFYILLSRTQGESQHLAEAYRSRAKAFMIYGDYSMAKVQLEQALHAPDLSTQAKIDIEKDLAKIKTLLPEKK